MKPKTLKIKSQNSEGVFLSDDKINKDLAGKFIKWDEYKMLTNYKGIKDKKTDSSEISNTKDKDESKN